METRRLQGLGPGFTNTIFETGFATVLQMRIIASFIPPPLIFLKFKLNSFEKFRYLGPALNRTNLHVLVHAQATKLVFQKLQVTGVQYILNEDLSKIFR